VVSEPPRSSVALRDLVVRREDDESFIVGRLDTGEFVVLPAVGVAALELLAEGMSPAQVEARLTAQHGETVDVVEFVDHLAALGFAARTTQADTSSECLRWIVPTRSWRRRALLLDAFGALTVASSVAAMATLVFHPELIPTYQFFFWLNSPTLILLGNTALFFANLSIHEFAHYVAVRFFGLPAKVSRIRVRFYHLVVHTDVSAARLLPRRQRLAVYLAGICWDVCSASSLIFVLGGLDVPPSVAAPLRGLLLVNVLGVASQTFIWMKTDLYYVIGDLLGDHGARLEQARAGVTRTLKRETKRTVDSDRVPAVVYLAAVVVGATLFVGVFVFYQLPIAITLIGRSLRALADGVQSSAGLALADGTTALAIQALFLVPLALAGARLVKQAIPGSDSHA
jgi:putative peptide zinc metalloprotease protein